MTRKEQFDAYYETIRERRERAQFGMWVVIGLEPDGPLGHLPLYRESPATWMWPTQLPRFWPEEDCDYMVRQIGIDQ